MEFIRKHVFGITQVEFAGIAKVAQGSVSRWELDKQDPTLSEMNRVRDEANKRGLDWDDSWFFDPPSVPLPDIVATDRRKYLSGNKRKRKLSEGASAA